MQPVRLVFTLLGGIAALAILGSFAPRRVRVDRAATSPRRLSLPLHYNRLATYYRPCAN